MIGIYKIINPTGKIYIGQSTNINKRWLYYKNNFKHINRQPALYNSLAKYGWDKHKTEILEECSIEQLNERETYWKQYYLNQVEGDWSKVLFCDLHDQGVGPRSEQTKRKISEGNKGKKKPNAGIRGNRGEKWKLWITKNSRFSKPDWSEKCKKPVLMIDKNTKQMLKEFKSVTEAANYIGVKQASLSLALNKENKTSGGFIWKSKI